MNTFHSKGRCLLIALLFVPWLRAIPSFAAAHESSFPAGFLSDNLPLFADFDGDDKVDEATLSSAGALKTIHIALAKSSWSSVSFDSSMPGRGRLLFRDIDNDGDIDLIWVASDSMTVVVCLGDGYGNFSVATGRGSNLRNIPGLLRNGGSRLSDNRSVPETRAVLLSRHSVVIHASEYNPNLFVQAATIEFQALTLRTLCFTIRTERGPPSDFC